MTRCRNWSEFLSLVSNIPSLELSRFEYFFLLWTIEMSSSSPPISSSNPSTANSSSLRKVATSEGPLCRLIKKKESTMSAPDQRLIASSSSETALEREVDAILAPVTYLTKRQRRFVVVTWLAVKDRTQFGLQVFADVFRKQPQMREHFSLLKNHPPAKTDSELDQVPGFRCQATVFSNFLDYIVGFVHLDSANFISDASFQIGRRHAERLRIDTIPSTWWRVFVDAIVANLRPYFPVGDSMAGRFPIVKYMLDRAYRRAWEKLLNAVVERMQQGFKDYRNEEKSYLLANGEDGNGEKEKKSTRPIVAPCQAQLKKLASIAAAVHAKHRRRFYEKENGIGGGDSDEDDLCDSDDTSSNSGSE